MLFRFSGWIKLILWFLFFPFSPVISDLTDSQQFNWWPDSNVKQQQRILTIWTILFVRNQEKGQGLCIVYRNLFIHFINYQMHNWITLRINSEGEYISVEYFTSIWLHIMETGIFKTIVVWLFSFCKKIN